MGDQFGQFAGCAMARVKQNENSQIGSVHAWYYRVLFLAWKIEGADKLAPVAAALIVFPAART
ncbi:hypothetical protein ACFS07_13845 [Undibacterium arcticum]